MFYFIGVLQLLIFGSVLFVGYKKQGLAIVTDAVKIMAMLWLFNIGMYNMQLSGLYNPNWQINLVVMIICSIFLIVGFKSYITEKDVINIVRDLKDDKRSIKIYSNFTNVIIVIALLLFLVSVYKNGLAILSENKINKQQLGHYSAYIIYMLAFCAQLKYILFRINKKKIDLLLFLISIGTLVLTLNRGPIAFIVAAIYIYEIYNLINVRKNISNKKFIAMIATLVILLIVFLEFFGYIGDLRMKYVLENIFHKTINEHYQAPDWMSSGSLWSYIYLTSPLENASYSIINQSVDFTFFNNLLYPFIKLGANILGLGASYKAWIMGRVGYTPYLQDSVGLNVSSFIPQAMQDLGYIGLIVYVFIYVGIAYFSIRLIKRKIKISALGSIMISINVINILLWSVFDNSLKIPILILNILLCLAIEIYRAKVLKISINKDGKIVDIRKNLKTKDVIS